MATHTLSSTAHQQHKIMHTTLFAYTLFGLVLLNTIISAATYWNGLASRSSSPQLVSAIAWVFGMSVVSTLLVPVAAYFVGYIAVRRRFMIKERRYNGVLMGLLASWLAAIFGSLPYIHPFFAITSKYEELVAPVIALLVAVALAYTYRLSKPRYTLFHSQFYQLSLLATALLTLIVTLGSFFTADKLYKEESLVGIAVVLALGLIMWIGARLSRERPILAKITDSLLAFAMGVFASQIVLMTLVMLGVRTFASAAPALVGVVSWALYLYILRTRVSK